MWLSGNLIVIFLAGLQNVPRVYHEAAEIDGANAWQRFWHVTFPSMTPIIFYNMLMSLITNMQVVTPALALTKGGPGKSSYFMSYMLYNYAFKQREMCIRDRLRSVLLPVACVPRGAEDNGGPVSYTHLDVYKRQPRTFPAPPCSPRTARM